MLSTAITKKGQVTIPKKIRKNMNLEANDQVVFIQRGNEIILKPLRNIFALRGIVKDKQKLDFENIRESVKKRVSKKISEE